MPSKTSIVDHHGDFEYLVRILENHRYQILNTDLPNEELIAIIVDPKNK